jgi:cytochrome P450/NADPH-cytochrome P450 reductase
MYYILKDPSVYYRLQAEVDEVLGAETIRKEHLGKLPYIVGAFSNNLLIQSSLTKAIAIMRETLRLNPTGWTTCLRRFQVTNRFFPAPLTGVKARENTIIGGKYPILGDQVFGINAVCIHRDPAVWGEDVCTMTRYAYLWLIIH